jgi:hypothetical protein
MRTFDNDTVSFVFTGAFTQLPTLNIDNLMLSKYSTFEKDFHACFRHSISRKSESLHPQFHPHLSPDLLHHSTPYKRLLPPKAVINIVSGAIHTKTSSLVSVSNMQFPKVRWRD